jgi:hypothetical protein
MTKASALERAYAAWGDAIPDWIVVLASQCDQSSQAEVARRIGRSPALVCNIIQAKYPGRLLVVERLVRGALMAERVACPVLGDLSSAVCAEHQRADLSTANPTAPRLYRTCPTCLHALPKGGKDVDGTD